MEGPFGLLFKGRLPPTPPNFVSNELEPDGMNADAPRDQGGNLHHVMSQR